MNLGFFDSNLEAAAAALVAATSGQDSLALNKKTGIQRYSLADRQEVRQYLMDSAAKVYGEKGAGVGGQIMGVVYRTIGVVFETVHGDGERMITLTSDQPEHLAMFWQTLELLRASLEEADG